jgi:hypothetical protein
MWRESRVKKKQLFGGNVGCGAMIDGFEWYRATGGGWRVSEVVIKQGGA